jgi:anaerobic ribonucleoside-triphosphate reductase activating protein
MWEPGTGEVWTPERLLEDIRSTEGIDGITLTGGEPLDQYEGVLEFLKMAFPIYEVFMTSGYTFKTILDRFPEVLSYLDILVDGPFIQELLDETASWMGSTNQTIRLLTNRSQKYENYKSEFGAEVIISGNNITMTGFGIPKSIEQGLK